MPTCFVSQPFDGGPFDARFDDTLAPAIEQVGFVAYRVDRDKTAAVPIERVQEAIGKADVVLADITMHNPNVWYEVGFAIAASKPLILLSKRGRRSRLPFNIQHRQVIFYRTESLKDLTQLQEEVKSRLRLYTSAANDEFHDSRPVFPHDALSQHARPELLLKADVDELKELMAAADAKKDSLFQRLLLICDRQKYSPYDGFDEPTTAGDIEKVGIDKAISFAKANGLGREFKTWLQRRQKKVR